MARPAAPPQDSKRQRRWPRKKTFSEYIHVPLDLPGDVYDGTFLDEIAAQLKRLVQKYGTVENLDKIHDKSFIESEYNSIAKHFNDSPNDRLKVKRVRSHLIKQQQCRLPQSEVFWRRIRIGFNSTIRLLEAAYSTPASTPRLIIVDSAESEQVAVEILRTMAAKVECRLVGVTDLTDVFRCQRKSISTVSVAAITSNVDDLLIDLDGLCNYVEFKVPLVKAPLNNTKEFQTQGQKFLTQSQKILSTLPQASAEPQEYGKVHEFVLPHVMEVPVRDTASRVEMRNFHLNEKVKKKLAKKKARKNAFKTS